MLQFTLLFNIIKKFRSTLKYVIEIYDFH